jgi:hypothetical protein
MFQRAWREHRRARLFAMQRRDRMAEPQNYRNHARLLPAFHFFALPVLLVNVFVQLWTLWGTPTIGSLWTVVVAAALFAVALLSRVQALKVQDRVIRLEMRLRLRALLSGELLGRIEELTPAQLAALRFAGDAEMPELVRNALAGTLKTPKDIKERVRDWQGDFLRA